MDWALALQLLRVPLTQSVLDGQRLQVDPLTPWYPGLHWHWVMRLLAGGLELLPGHACERFVLLPGQYVLATHDAHWLVPPKP